jgi:endonuclease/exonuclease/phosphatase family metal-dependent hydrolase
VSAAAAPEVREPRQPTPAQAQPVNAYGLPKPLPKSPGGCRVATYNLLNLFDHVDDPALEGDQDDMKLAVTPERATKLAEAIIATDADVVGLQEIESLAALTWFRDTYLPRAGYEHVASIDVGYYRGVECSVLSRFPIRETRTFSDLSLDDVKREGPGWAPPPPAESGPATGLHFQRSPLMVEVQVDRDYRLTLLIVHHKSGAAFDFQREAEALKTVEIIDSIRSRDPRVNLVVMGDFNAAPWDKSLRVYLQAAMIDTLAHRFVQRAREGTQDEARLYKTHESNRVLDYILLDSGAYRELVIGSAHVFGTLTPPPSYDWTKDPHPPGYASDHYPVMIDLRPKDR